MQAPVVTADLIVETWNGCFLRYVVLAHFLSIARLPCLLTAVLCKFYQSVFIPAAHY